MRVDESAERIEDRGRRHAAAAVVGEARGLLGLPDRAPLEDLGPLIDGRERVALECFDEDVRGDAHVSEHRNGDRMEATERVGIEIDLHDRLVRRDARVIAERRPEHEQEVGFVHEPRRDRGTAAAEHTAAERVVVGD